MVELIKSISGRLVFLFIGFIFTACYCWAITFYNIPKANERLADVILGVLLGSCVKEAYSYLFGSTQGSQTKDAANKDTMDNLVTQLGNSTPISLPAITPIAAPITIPSIINSPLTIEQLIADCKDLPSLEALLPKVQINGIPQTVVDLYNKKKLELT